MRWPKRKHHMYYLRFTLVGAEGFEASFPSGHYAVFFVEIKGKPDQNQRLPNFSGVPFFPYFLTRGPHSARNWYHWYHPLSRVRLKAS